MKKRFIIVIITILSLSVVLSGCGVKNPDEDKEGYISIAAMNGPTMMGLGKLFDTVKGQGDASKYKITKENTPDTVIAGLANKTYDVACIPCNNASIIYNSGNIDIQVAVINTTNVLYLVQKAGTPKITTLADLAGKTVYSPGQGSTPEFVFKYLLEKNNVKNVTVEFETEGSTIAAGIKTASSKYDYAVLPQPAATTAISGQGAAEEVLNLTKEWEKFQPDCDIVTGVLVVRRAFLVNNKNAFDKFLEDYKASVDFMTNTDNAENAAQYVVDMGIMPQTALAMAQKAVPKCGISFISGEDMKKSVSNFIEILYNQNKDSVGGAIPKNNFYYAG